jgi:hypothetical protein
MPDVTARNVAARYALTKEPPTAESLARLIEQQLGSLFKGLAFSTYVEKILGEVSVSVDFFQVTKGATGVVLWNAPKYIKVGIRAKGWKPGEPAPDKLEVSTVRFKGVKKMRKTSGPPDKVLQSVVTWFRNNQKDLTSGTDL